MTTARYIGIVAVVLWASASALRAEEPAKSVEFFEKRIRPIFIEHCQKCHGDLKGKAPKGGLRVDSRAGLLKGGDNGPAIVVGDPEKSRLIDAVRFKNPDLQMPPKGKLGDAVIADLIAWVKAGANWPADLAETSTTIASFDLAKRKRDHWAWQAVRPSPPPKVVDAAWPATPVDRFILAKLDEKGIKPAPAADRRTWIRRVTFDLIGLPPTPAEIDAFLADTTSEAFAHVVDRLLASPRFGERWARHWLDLVRYAETRGHEFDAIIPNAYQYRDYVIRAINADVPYDRFVQEHIAGDLIPNPRKHPTEGFNESILGTGFWFLGEEVHSPVDIRQDQADRFDNRIDVFGKAFLGLTIACARCHDHKFDAISTKDYYALYGFLESSGYRQVRFDSLEQNRRVASELAELNRSSGKAVAAALSRAATPATKQLEDYLLAARSAIRTGPEFGAGDEADIVFEDFESGTYAKWELAGTALGDKPQTLATIGEYQGKINAGGKYFVNSHNIRTGGDVTRGDAHKGTMTSKEFTVSRRNITMLVGGGAHEGKTCVNLLVGGKAVRTATGRNNNQMFPVRWDVRDLKGKVARIQIVDDHTGSWGNVGVDDIVFTDRDPVGDLPGDIKAEDFAPIFQARIAEVARKEKLDAELLTDWVRATLRAVRDPNDPFYLWAKIATEPIADDPIRIAEHLKAIRLPSDADVVIDYARRQPHEWLPDDASFGVGPVKPGDLAIENGRVSFADRAAAVYDRAWDDLAVPSKTENDPGAIGKRVRAGRTIRTPAFKISQGKLHYLMKGAGTAYVAVDGHTSIQGPLHGQLVAEFPASAGFRWVTHDLTPYVGHIAHVEFTPVAKNDFAIAMVIQGATAPTLPKYSFLPEEKVESVRELAAAYQRSVAALVDRMKSGPPTTETEARLANSLIGRSILLKATNDLDAARATFTETRERIIARRASTSRLAPAIWEGTGVDEHVFIRGSPKGLGERVPRRFLEALDGTEAISSRPGSGRLELARRTSENQFAARVFVNRVWHHLFGRGIVGSVDNFGVLGESPTHPELLDFLADRFVADGWSLKRLARDLVLSSTYRMASRGDAATDRADPQNLLLHRMRLRRLEGEAIRDSMLAVSGRLDSTPFGPSVPIHLTPFLDGRGRPTASGPIDGNGRRSVYLAVRRNFLNPMLLAFDTPIPFSTVGRRQVSNVPAQALILLNDPFVQEQAAVWARAKLDRPGSPTEKIRDMYLVAFGRLPTSDESSACLEFLREQSDRHGSPADSLKPWADLAHTLFNAKEFIYVD